MNNKFLLGLTIVSSFLFPLVGCKKDKTTIHVQVSHTLSEYINYVDDITGDPLTNTHVKCGKRYKLIYNVDFKNKDQFDTDCIMKIRMGTLDNDENRERQELVHNKEELGGGVGFTTKNDEYTSTFRINENLSIKWERTYFVVGIDTLGPSGRPYPEDVTMILNGTDSEYTYLVNNVLNKYNFTLNLVKGDMSFTFEDNIFKKISPSLDFSGFSIKVPRQATKIGIEIVDAKDQSLKYGMAQYDTSDYSEDNDVLDVNIIEILIDQLGEDMFRQLTAGQKFIDSKIEITAYGGNNYNNITLAVDQKIN